MAKSNDSQPRAWVIITKQVAGRTVCLAGLRGPACRNAGQWNFFGGGVEPGESPAEAAARELNEETGAFVEAKHLRFVFKDLVGRKSCTWFTVDSQHVDMTRLNTTPEVTDFEWITIQWGLRQDLHYSISSFFHFLTTKEEEPMVDQLGYLTALKQKKLI